MRLNAQGVSRSNGVGVQLFRDQSDLGKSNRDSLENTVYNLSVLSNVQSLPVAVFSACIVLPLIFVQVKLSAESGFDVSLLMTHTLLDPHTYMPRL